MFGIRGGKGDKLGIIWAKVLNFGISGEKLISLGSLGEKGDKSIT
jgi:hypothetical protein